MSWRCHLQCGNVIQHLSVIGYPFYSVHVSMFGLELFPDKLAKFVKLKSPRQAFVSPTCVLCVYKHKESSAVDLLNRKGRSRLSSPVDR